MRLYDKAYKFIIIKLFLALISSATLADIASAKSGIVINEDEVIVTMTDGYPVLKTKIGSETYRFLITPSHPHIWISPEIAAKFRLQENASKGNGIVSDDTFMFKSYRNTLKIGFSGLEEKEYTVNWFARPQYEGFDGSVDLTVFESRKITFIFDDKISRNTMKKRTYHEIGGGKWGWRQWQRRFADRRDFLIYFSPYYDASRLSMGGSYAFLNDDNLSFTGEPYYMPKAWAGYRQFVLGEFKKPISPLKGLTPLSRADVEIKEGYLDAAVETSQDVVVANAKSKRGYLPVLDLGRDYFEGCHSVVFPRSGTKLTTYCPDL